MILKFLAVIVVSAALFGCKKAEERSPTAQIAAPVLAPKTMLISDRGLTIVDVQPIGTIHLPYAVTVLPTGDMLVLEAAKGIMIVGRNGALAPAPITGVPTSFGAKFDVILDPDYVRNHRIYVSYIEYEGEKNPPNWLAVLSATLSLNEGGGHLSDVKVIWRQKEQFASGQYGGHMVFSPDGRYLFITSGERSQFTPSQDMTSTLGKVIRIFSNGRIPRSNPFYSRKDVPGEIWTIGHRNQYGLAFDKAGTLWEHDMGPKGGDEMNIIEPGKNYGWPNATWGNHYDGTPMPKPQSGDGFVPPVIQWTPVIAPSGMIIYSGNTIESLSGRAIIGGLRSEGLVIVRIDGRSAVEEDRINLGTRIRDVRQGLDGELWVLEDRPSSRLLRITPARTPAPVAAGD